MQSTPNRWYAALLLIALMAATARASDWERSVALYNKGDYAAALAEFQDLIIERPDAAGAWYYIGLCEYKLKHYDRVETPMARAIDLMEVQSPASAEIAGAWYTIGISHYIAGHYDKAVEPLKRYIELNTNAKREVDAAARTALGRVYYQLERFDEAEAAFAAANGKPNSAEKSKEAGANYYYLGAIYFKREDDDRAIAALREAVKANPEEAAAMDLLAESLIRKARKTSANALWLEAAEVGERLRAIRDDEKTANVLGRAYFAARQFDKAVAPLEKIAKANTDNGQAWLLYGIALSRSGQMRKAMEALEITLQLLPDSVAALSELGYVYESDKQYQQALRIYERAFAATNDPAIKASVERVRALASQQP
ncbi:MAG TPA: tetratricopeptide repeat protein [Blastocatellia bacterium]|nr:tetratricopeptide repeat protein [Blastocatellia bacterium]